MKKKANFSFQDMKDREPKLQHAPPIFEIRNALEIHTKSERIVMVDQFFGPGGWKWYVQLYGQYRAICTQSM